MRIAVATLESLSHYSQSKKIQSVRGDKDDFKEFEQRTWKERCHVDSKGELFIPPMQFKKALEGAGSALRMVIPGKSPSEYGKRFKSGVLVSDPLMLGIMLDQVEGEWLFLEGSPGTQKKTRVDKCMPFIREWSGEVTYYILDDIITESVFEKHLIESGNFVGIGRFRPAVGGFYGRYKIIKIRWS